MKSCFDIQVPRACGNNYKPTRPSEQPAFNIWRPILDEHITANYGFVLRDNNLNAGNMLVAPVDLFRPRLCATTRPFCDHVNFEA